jgi:phage shock protein PspC (stress-responsive transcriptional regulator)
MGLYRSRQHRIFGGVCGGIAHHLGWDPNLVRAFYVVLSLCSTLFPGLVVYLVLWVVLPEGPEAAG